MKISTKGRYALRVMVEFAAHDGEVLSLKHVSEAQKISLKYLEQIVQMLVKHNLLLSFRGTNGGYKLTQKPSEITVAAILNATEGNLSVVNCVTDKSVCNNCSNCFGSIFNIASCLVINPSASISTDDCSSTT